jgi:hypothetical protein
LCSRSSAQAAQARAGIGHLEASAAAADLILGQDEQQALAAAASEVRESPGEGLRRS